MFGLAEALDGVTDRRLYPRIRTGTVVRSALVMIIARLGSLNALEQTRPSRFWSTWIGGKPPSADSMGRIAAGLSHADLRAVNHELYSRLKRKKAIRAPWHGLVALVLDGHESHSTYHRKCDGCLQRVVNTAKGERIQHYHRNVTAQLITGDMYLLIDAEPQLPGEDEIATALRLLERVLVAYPRAFDVVLGDSLYADSRFFKFLASRGKYALTVFKDDRRNLYADARALFEVTEPIAVTRGRTDATCWDIDGFTSWPQVEMPVRVVRSLEKTIVTRQIDGEPEELVAEWIWVTTIPPATADTKAVVEIGHSRWSVENQGFNETSTRWHADHVYKHDGDAILSFWLISMIALNVFQVFFGRNLKPAFRAKVSMLHIAREILAELYGEMPAPNRRPP